MYLHVLIQRGPERVCDLDIFMSLVTFHRQKLHLPILYVVIYSISRVVKVEALQ